MASKGVNLPIAVDASGTIKGAGDVETALEKVADSLDDLGDAGKTNDREVARSMDRVEDASTDAARTLERKFKDAFDDVKKEAKRAGDDVGDRMKRGTREAASGLDEMKGEAAGTAREVAASFDGSAESIAGGFQEVAANAFLGFGPPGAAAGLAAAAGAGIFATMWTERTEAVKQDVGDMYDDMLESGLDYLSKDYQQQVYWDILKGESAILNARNLQAIASNASATESDVALAYAGNIEKMTEVTQGLIDRRAIFQAQLRDESDTNDSAAQASLDYTQQMIDGLAARAQQIEDETAKISAQRDAWDQAARDASGAIEGTISNYEDAMRRMREVTAPVVRPTVDLADVDRALRNYRPVIVGEVRFGKAAV